MSSPSAGAPSAEVATHDPELQRIIELIRSIPFCPYEDQRKQKVEESIVQITALYQQRAKAPTSSGPSESHTPPQYCWPSRSASASMILAQTDRQTTCHSNVCARARKAYAS
jgi:hypothetical protein